MDSLADLSGVLPSFRPPADPDAPTVIDPKRIRNSSLDLTPTTKTRVVWEDRLSVQQAIAANTARTIEAHISRFLESTS
jgi:hypothetical protein